MVETRGSEAVAQLVREAFVGAEDDACQHGPALPLDPGRKRPDEPRAQPVGDAADTAPARDELPRVGVHHHLDALPVEPRRLVEAMLLAVRTPHVGGEPEDAALGWRAPERELEQHRFTQAKSAEPRYLGRHPQPKHPPADGSGHDDHGASRLADVPHEDAGVERRHARRPPPPTGHHEREGDHDDARAPLDGSRRERERRGERPREPGSAQFGRGGETEAER